MKKLILLVVALVASLSLHSCMYNFSEEELAEHELDRGGQLSQRLKEKMKIDISKRDYCGNFDDLEDGSQDSQGNF